MLKLSLTEQLTDQQVKDRAGTFAAPEEVRYLLGGDTKVFMPDGTLLCVLRRNVLSDHAKKLAWPALHALKTKTTDNRGIYGGGKRQSARKRTDGKVSRQNRVVDEDGRVIKVSSNVIGFWGREPRIPFCRQTAFTANQAQQWDHCQPMIREVAQVFREAAPARYAVQQRFAESCEPDYVIEGTPFSTITVNNTIVSQQHQDKGDFKEGMGCISVMRRGTFDGCWLVFSQYRVGVDLRDGDVLLFNSHAWHANTPLTNMSGDHERISTVYYFRTNIRECLSLRHELARAQEQGAFNLHK